MRRRKRGSNAMVRYGVPIVAGLFYIVGSVWLVRNEGRTYRETLLRARSQSGASPAPPVVSDPSVERVPEVTMLEVTDSSPGSKPLRPQAPPEQSLPIPVAPPAEFAGEKASSLGDSRRVAAVQASPPEASATPATTPAPDDLRAVVTRWKRDPFWSQAYLTRRWNVDRLTLQDERQLGEQLNDLILRFNPEDREIDLTRIKRAAEPLLHALVSKDRQYRVFVLDSEVANAFSHPGGYIYVTRKLLDLLPEDEDSLLEFVIGHEIAHVEFQHALTCLRDPGVRRFGDGTLQKLYFLILQYGYPDDLEFAADEWIYRRMRRLQRSEHDCLKYLRILDGYARTHGFSNGRGKPEELLKPQRDDGEDGLAISPIDNHLRSHPAASDRLRRLKKLGEALRQ